MFKNPSTKFSKIKGAKILINTENAAVVGLDDKTYSEYLEILQDKKVNREMYDFLTENGFISTFNNFNKNTDGRL